MEENLPATTTSQELSASKVSVSLEVFANLASLAALEVKGVVDLAAESRVTEALGLKRLTRGVRVKVGGREPESQVLDLGPIQSGEKALELDVLISVDAAAVLPEVAAEVQQKVAERIEHSLKIKTAGVNVVIFHVKQPQDTQPEA